MTLRVLLVDDEPLARSRLRRLLGAHEDVEVVGEAGSGAEALSQIAALQPDALLLDIEMPGMDGLALAEDPRAPAVVFTTAHAQYGVEAFEADAADYLLKPVSRERLARALEKLRTHLGAARRADAGESEAWRLVVTEGARKRFLDARSVDLFLADQKYVVCTVDGQELVLRESLDALETRLAPLGFVRAHRGALVRRDAVVAFDASGGGTLSMRDGGEVPVSRRALASVKAALGVT